MCEGVRIGKMGADRERKTMFRGGSGNFPQILRYFIQNNARPISFSLSHYLLWLTFVLDKFIEVLRRCLPFLLD